MRGEYMLKFKIYLSASTQEHNVGTDGYNEEEFMFILRDAIEDYIKLVYKSYIEIYKNADKKMSLTDIVKDSNSKKVDLHIANHSNAGNKDTRGCEAFYSHLNTNGKGKKFAQLWYDEISKVTPSKDRGVFSDSRLYDSGLYELSKTSAVAVLMEHFYHTNSLDVSFARANIMLFAEATVRAIASYFGLKAPKNENLNWKEILKKMSTYSDVWIKFVNKHPEVNLPGLIQKLYYKEEK